MAGMATKKTRRLAASINDSGKKPRRRAAHPREMTMNMGAMVVMIRVVNESHPDGVIAALLLGSVLAPLIDYVVVWFNIRKRARRCG